MVKKNDIYYRQRKWTYKELNSYLVPYRLGSKKMYDKNREIMTPMHSLQTDLIFKQWQ